MEKRAGVMGFLVPVCVLVLSFALAGASETNTMSVDEIRPGMKGKARSVFSGSRIEEFDIEILGILRDWRPGGDLILARASGQPVEYTGIAAGMSGTPVYVDGKLIGAMAYAWPFSKEPITGITPIGEMFEHGAAYGASEGERRGSLRWQGSGISGGALEAIETPLLISGFHPAVLRVVEEELKGFNVTVAQTGSGSELVEGTGLVPGAPLAAQLVSGDATMSAIGTVTYTEGNRVLGFGHGLFMAGPVAIPMSTAYIHAVLPSLSGSMKLGSASQIVGTITGDGVAGVVGEMGQSPDLVPVHVSVEVDRVRTSEFDFGVMRHSLLTPSLVGWSVSSAALTVSRSVGEMTVRVECEIEVDGHDGVRHGVTYENVFFTTNPAVAIGESLSGPIGLLMQNQFEEAHVRGITCKLFIEHEQRVAFIEEVYVGSEDVMAGDSVSVTVRLKPFREESLLKQIVLHIPEGCRAEEVKIKVCAAPEMRRWEGQSTNRRLSPRNLEQLMTQIADSGQGNRIECVAYEEGEEVGIHGEAFPSPPQSFSSVLRTSGRAGTLAQTRVGILCGSVLDTEYVIQGCRTVSLKLEHGRRRR